MARRRDRVSAERSTGAREFDRANGSLPRTNDRDFKDHIVFDPFAAVEPSFRESGKRVPQSGRVWGYGAQPHASREDGKKRRRFGYLFGAASGWLPLPFSAKPVFDLPHRVKVCLRRKQRREVLFAFRRAGYSGSAPKRSYRRTANSFYGC